MSVVKSSEISQRRADGDAVAAKMAEIGGETWICERRRTREEDDGDLGRRRCRVRRWRSPATTASWNGGKDEDEGGDVRDLRWRRLQWWKATATVTASSDLTMMAAEDVS